MYKEPVMSVKGYVMVFLSLLLMTGLTVGISFVNLGRWNAFVAVLIALVKATLVVLFFMHVRFASRLVAVYAVGGAYWLVILFALTMTEVVARGGADVTGQVGIREDLPWLDQR